MREQIIYQCEDSTYAYTLNVIYKNENWVIGLLELSNDRDKSELTDRIICLHLNCEYKTNETDEFYNKRYILPKKIPCILSNISKNMPNKCYCLTTYPIDIDFLNKMRNW